MKLCNYLIEANVPNGDDEGDEREWNHCRRLGQIRVKTCDRCAFNHKNRALRDKAKKYYRVMKK